MSKLANKELRQRIFDKYKGKCAYCGCELTKKIFTIDHINPKKRHLSGKHGSDSEDNFNPCCASCNSSKSDWDIEQWRVRIELKYSRLIRDSSGFRLLVRFGLVTQKNKVVFYFEKVGGVL